MTKTWFTSDTHFGHAGIIRHCKRPWANVPLMNEGLIERWNDVVREHDDVYHAGDFMFLDKEHDLEYYLDRLNGRIHFIEGNHDSIKAHERKLFASYQEVKYLRLNGEQIFISHYAHRVWRNSHRGAWHVYGHTHGSIPNFHRSMDIGVDCHDYRPIEFEELKAYMDKQDFTLHHPELKADPWTKDAQEAEAHRRGL